MIRHTLGAAVLAVALPAAALACGPDSDCVLEDGRTYRIALPKGDGPFPAAVYFHGYRGTAAGVMNDKALRTVAADLGIALVAAQAGEDDWLLAHAPRKGLTDDPELAYVDALLQDITTRFPIAPDRLLATGFSAGGMMVWTLACHRADRFAAFLPVAGTFWAPIPQSCPNAPVDLLHIHGTSDPVVPLAGRAIADTRQGDVEAALALFAKAGNYTPVPDDLAPPPDLTCKVEKNPTGHRLALCLHADGHRYDAPWLTFGWHTLFP